MKNILNHSFAKSFLLLSILICITACTSFSPYKVPVLQGNIYEDEDIEKLSEGLTKDQVQFIFGTSMIKDPFHKNRWDYYYSVKVGNKYLSESKLSIFFDENNLVDSWVIEELSE
ncbi:MAG: cell envelope protein SmpA [Gammaproteobacteria bacterium]|nr:cell envelope protein SmpA [Gammaproteobacteria bacterium]